MIKRKLPPAPPGKPATYFRIFSYVVPASRARAFRRTYGSNGTWARLFAEADGYLGTKLLERRAVKNEYLTIDTWRSEAAWLTFIASYGQRYRQLSTKYRALYRTECEIGSFVAHP